MSGTLACVPCFMATLHAPHRLVCCACFFALPVPVSSTVAEFLRGGAIVVRTLPNTAAKVSTDYSGTNPPYMSAEAMAWLREECGVEHFLVDLPSVDKESDGGALLGHSAFWGVPPKKTPAHLSHRTITELCYVPDHVEDGVYLLDLQVAPIDLDAAPSRPLLYRLVGRAGRGAGAVSGDVVSDDGTANPHAPSPLPGILCGADGGFAQKCVQERLSHIVDAVVKHNAYDEAQVAALAELGEETRRGGAATILPLPAGDEWGHYVLPFVGSTWMKAPWWFVEHLFYRRMLNGVRYWYGTAWVLCQVATRDDICDALRRATRLDPFQSQKDAALVAADRVFGALVVPLLHTSKCVVAA